MLAIVQARMSSRRLPGKVLRPLAGRPVLAWLLDRLRTAERVDRVIVATSDGTDDDAICAFCSEVGIECFRGSLDDVAERLAAAAEWAGEAAFVRICGDSPLMASDVVDEIVALFEIARVDLATNVQIRTFPKGTSVEAVSVSALRRARSMMQPGEAEHVTPVFYRRPQDFRIVNLTSGGDFGDVQMSVDTEADFALAERMISGLRGRAGRPGLADLVALRERCCGEAPP
jgi:spore coat polysaccharide biosynthesis protein SpsF